MSFRIIQEVDQKYSSFSVANGEAKAQKAALAEGQGQVPHLVRARLPPFCAVFLPFPSWRLWPQHESGVGHPTFQFSPGSLVSSWTALGLISLSVNQRGKPSLPLKAATRVKWTNSYREGRIRVPGTEEPLTGPHLPRPRQTRRNEVPTEAYSSERTPVHLSFEERVHLPTPLL